MIRNIFDTHFHLSADDSMDEIIREGAELGVEWFMEAGAKPGQMKHMLERLKPYPNVFAAVGVHPLDVKDFDLDYELYKELAQESQVRAIGEIGLDYYYEKDSRNLQKDVFKEFLSLSAATEKPAIIHCRDAFEDLYKIFDSSINQQDAFVVHCFSEGQEVAEKVLSYGGLISFTGLITFKNADKIREAMKVVPLDKIMFETDTPYLTPVPYRGKRNQPAYTRYVIQHAADVLGMELQELIDISTRNAFRFFKINNP